jgi:adenylate cyclase
VEIQRARPKRSEDLRAYDLYLRALPELYAVTEQGFRRAEALLREAVLHDPEYAEAVAALADCVGRSAINGWIADAPRGMREARALALRAIDLDPENGTAHATAAWAQGVFGGSLDNAVELAHRALRLHPNSAYVRVCCGLAFVFAGDQELALRQFEAARRMSPFDPREYNTLTATAMSYFFLKEFEESLQWTARALERRASVVSFVYRAAALAHLGRIEEARTTIEQLLKVQPVITIRVCLQYRFRHEWMLDLLIDGVRKAGLPE